MPHYGCRWLFLADTLDEGLAWCEDMLILQQEGKADQDPEGEGEGEGEGQRDGGEAGSRKAAGTAILTLLHIVCFD